MIHYLKRWAEGLLAAVGEVPLRSTLTVTGLRDQHLGPRWEFARVQLRIEAASSFEVVDRVAADPQLQKLGFPDCVIFGLLDVLMVAESAPLTSVRITLIKADYDAIDTSPIAFRHAGRDAGRKIIKALSEGRSNAPAGEG